MGVVLQLFKALAPARAVWCVKLVKRFVCDCAVFALVIRLNQMLVVLICLRQAGESGWPRGDVPARDFLIDPKKAELAPVSL